MSETDLDRIHEFTSLVIASTRSPRQRERLQRALGLSLSETNLGVLRHGAAPRPDRGERGGAPPRGRPVEREPSAARARGPGSRDAHASIPPTGASRASRSPRPDGACSTGRAPVALNDYAVALDDWSARRPRPARRPARPLPRRAARHRTRRVGLGGRQDSGRRQSANPTSHVEERGLPLGIGQETLDGRTAVVTGCRRAWIGLAGHRGVRRASGIRVLMTDRDDVSAG